MFWTSDPRLWWLCMWWGCLIKSCIWLGVESLFWWNASMESVTRDSVVSAVFQVMSVWCLWCIRWCHCQSVYFICIFICISFVFVHVQFASVFVSAFVFVYMFIYWYIYLYLLSLFLVKRFHRVSDPRHSVWCQFDVSVVSGNLCFVFYI